jgi:GNAT superfamily N-acetyltransferase
VADVSVRPAGPPDADLVAQVQLETWRTAYADLLPAEALGLPEDEVATAWRQAITSPATPRHRVLVAWDGAALVGFAASQPAEDEGLDPATTTELSALLVVPRWGRRGHASRLLSACVEFWRGDGVATVVTWAWESDDATRSFLATSGWEPDGLGRSLDTGEAQHRQLRLHTSLAERTELPLV